MKIIKYIKKNNGKYKIILENNEIIEIYEEVILKNNLLYKKEIDNELYNIITNDNIYEEAYNKAIKYISIRIRSIHETKLYLKNKKYSDEIISEVINRLIKNKFLNDECFVKAFINDKIKFTTMGPYKIKLELKKHGIDNEIIDKYINNIDIDIIYQKVDKLVNKYIKTNKKYCDYMLKNKIYNNLIKLGYSSSVVLDILKKNNV